MGTNVGNTRLSVKLLLVALSLETLSRELGKDARLRIYDKNIVSKIFTVI